MNNIFGKVLPLTTIGFVNGHHEVKPGCRCEGMVQEWMCDWTHSLFASLEIKSRK
jgi:hypothetical protein